MKVVILAGGLGTRLSEETQLKPKPMAEIGEHPILWHIMKIYGQLRLRRLRHLPGLQGLRDQGVLRQLLPAQLATSPSTCAGRRWRCTQHTVEPWKVTLVDTGAETQTGGRLKRVASYLGDERFMITYGDGVADIDIGALLAFHEAHGKLATVTAVQPPGRFGALELADDERDGAARSPRSRAATAPGSTAASSCSSPACSTTSTATRPPSGARAAGAPRRATASSSPIATAASGSPWTRCATSALLEELWAADNAPWKIW